MILFIKNNLIYDSHISKEREKKHVFPIVSLVNDLLMMFDEVINHKIFNEGNKINLIRMIRFIILNSNIAYFYLSYSVQKVKRKCNIDKYDENRF